MKLKLLSICLFLFLIADHASAQRLLRAYSSYARSSKAGKRMMQRYYIGVGTCMMNIDIKQRYYDDVYAKNIKTTVKSTASYSVTEGFFFPFSKSGKEGAFGLDIASTVNLFNYNVGTIAYSPETTVTETGFVYQYLLPIGIAYKSGGEAILNKKSKFLFTTAVGIAPSLAISKVITPDACFSSRKFIMFEMGYFAGIAFKVRATAYFGTINLVNTTESDLSFVTSGTGYSGGSVDNLVTGKTGLSLSLSLMPFSWDWARKDDFDY
ncbi:MAG: hypothetical protein H7257_01920 [Taibaiella sp.]|nr:hypothetical protein [Taibaiella sp.]